MKIPKALSVERQTKVWNLRCKGYTYNEIAQEVGISHNSVTKILNRITKQYQKNHLADVERIKTEQVASLETVSSEAFQAWERSKESSKILRQEKGIASTGETLGIAKQTSEVRDQDGDPRYLQVFMKAKEDIRKIVGADAPIKQELTGKDGKPIEITDPTAKDRLLARLAEEASKEGSGDADSKPLTAAGE